MLCLVTRLTQFFLNSDDHNVNALQVSRFPDAYELHPEVELAIWQFVGLLLNEPAQSLGKAFSFRWIQSSNGVDNTLWLLYFYGRLEYFCSTFHVASLESTTLEEELRKVRLASTGLNV
jgi:hypothetical protein